MKRIEIWPKKIELGDAVIDDSSFPYLRLADPESGIEVVALIRPDAAEVLLAQLAVLAVRLQNKPN